MLADRDSLDRRFDSAQKKAKGGERDAKALVELMEPALLALREGKPARGVAPADPERRREFQRLGLITAKPMLYLLNLDETSAATGNEFSQRAAARAEALGADHVSMSAAIESEIAQLRDPAERRDFLATLGLEEPGLDRFIRAGYHLLDLITFFTAGPKETRAWTVKRGAKAPEAAGVIHTDFEHGFIRAETISYADYVACGGEQGAKDAGKMRQEGKDYVVRDGDVMLFRFNV
jgi:GTP-binding protein YchF